MRSLTLRTVQAGDCRVVIRVGSRLMVKEGAYGPHVDVALKVGGCCGSGLGGRYGYINGLGGRYGYIN